MIVRLILALFVAQSTVAYQRQTCSSSACLDGTSKAGILAYNKAQGTAYTPGTYPSSSVILSALVPSALNQSINANNDQVTISFPSYPVSFTEHGYTGSPMTWSSAGWTDREWKSVLLPSQWCAILGDGYALWGAVPDSKQLPSGLSSKDIVGARSGACIPACTDKGICISTNSSTAACQCQSGWDGQQCDVCAKGFYGSSCQACDAGCEVCDDGLAGTGHCLSLPSSNAIDRQHVTAYTVPVPLMGAVPAPLDGNPLAGRNKSARHAPRVFFRMFMTTVWPAPWDAPPVPSQPAQTRRPSARRVPPIFLSRLPLRPLARPLERVPRDSIGTLLLPHVKVARRRVRAAPAPIPPIVWPAPHPGSIWLALAWGTMSVPVCVIPACRDCRGVLLSITLRASAMRALRVRTDTTFQREVAVPMGPVRNATHRAQLASAVRHIAPLVLRPYSPLEVVAQRHVPLAFSLQLPQTPQPAFHVPHRVPLVPPLSPLPHAPPAPRPPQCSSSVDASHTVLKTCTGTRPTLRVKHATITVDLVLPLARHPVHHAWTDSCWNEGPVFGQDATLDESLWGLFGLPAGLAVVGLVVWWVIMERRRTREATKEFGRGMGVHHVKDALMALRLERVFGFRRFPDPEDLTPAFDHTTRNTPQWDWEAAWEAREMGLNLNKSQQSDSSVRGERRDGERSRRWKDLFHLRKHNTPKRAMTKMDLERNSVDQRESWFVPPPPYHPASSQPTPQDDSADLSSNVPESTGGRDGHRVGINGMRVGSGISRPISTSKIVSLESPTMATWPFLPSSTNPSDSSFHSNGRGGGGSGVGEGEHGSTSGVGDEVEHGGEVGETREKGLGPRSLYPPPRPRIERERQVIRTSGRLSDLWPALGKKEREEQGWV
ncbi:hypothetical protein M231_02796 [Tremella mesenterica]|uniref:EGF-like domain-containing protein n=1 Tax=Tremella mesenterica TaxID=5217 RepID=A0A4Q1BQ04_TREME|nr:hypothetical protein M231_02796 [Tremella mesenterica]